VCAVGVLGVSSSAWADTASFPAVTPPPPDSSAPPVSAEAPAAPAEVAEDASWDAAYALARSAMAQGEFGLAASSFADLARRARTPEKRALCSELQGLAQHWADAGLTLLQPQERTAREPGGVRLNERTTDEISVLYLNSVVYGLGTGVWLAAVTEPKDAASGILPALGLAGAAAGAVALVDHSSRLGYGVPASAVTGLYIGLEEGITWSLWNQAKAPYFDEWQGKTVATVIWGSATVGAITGAAVGSIAGTTPGRASYVGSTALWGGLLTGFFTAAATADDRGQRDDAGLLGAALGTNIGTVAGVLTAGTLSPSVARVRFIDLGGIAGGLVAGGLYVSAANDLTDSSVQGLFGVTALGIAGGLAISTVLTQSMPADRGVTIAEPPSALNIEPTLIPVRGGTLIGAAGTF
jgi:hypothetical protein